MPARQRTEPKGLLQPRCVVVAGKHIQEVLAHDLGINIHEQAVLALGYEIPAVIVGLVAHAVVHKDLVQSLERQEAGVGVGGGAVGIGPILRDEGVEDAGLDHLALDLVAILNEGHGKGAGLLQGVSGELLKDLVVLGLLPLNSML